MRSNQMWVRCGLVAMMVMSTCVSAAPGPRQVRPGLASAITGMEATQTSLVAPPQLDAWAVDWHGRVFLWVSCPTPGAVLRYTLDGSIPQWYSPVCPSPLIVTGHGIVMVRSMKDGVYNNVILVITIS